MMTDKSKPKKLKAVKKDAFLKVYPCGFVSSAGIEKIVDISNLLNHRRKAGDICRFSLASRRRLRLFLVSHDIPGSLLMGLTLTLPSAALLSSDLFSVFPRVVQLFGQKFKRAFTRSALVWRAELQKRGVPHLHCILYMHQSDLEKIEKWPGDNLRMVYHPLFLQFVEFWFSAVFNSGLFVGDSRQAQEWCDLMSEQKGVYLDVLPRHQSRLFRYMCDHASKSKKEQLGYVGRQWGVIGRDRLVNMDFEQVECSSGKDRARVIILRTLRMIRRRRCKDSSVPFGWHHSKPSTMVANGITYALPATVSRLMEYAKTLASEQAGNEWRAPSIARSEVAGVSNFQADDNSVLIDGQKQVLSTAKGPVSDGRHEAAETGVAGRSP